MYGHQLHWEVFDPTVTNSGATNPPPGYSVGASVTFTVGDQVELTGYFDADSDLTHDQVISTWHNVSVYPLGGNFLGSDGNIHQTIPGPNDTWTITGTYSGQPFNGYEISGLPTIENVTLDPSSSHTPRIWWDDNDIFVDNQGLTYAPGDVVKYDITFKAGTPIAALLGNPGFVDVGATNQSIGPNIAIDNGFTFDLNQNYNGVVQFTGSTGTLKLEQAVGSVTVQNFVTNSEQFDFSAITQGNAAVVGTISGSTLNAHSVGWVSNGTDTTVYVNATDQVETTTAADLTVHVQNVTQLHNHDFIV